MSMQTSTIATNATRPVTIPQYTHDIQQTLAPRDASPSFLIETSLLAQVQPAMRYTHLPAFRLASASALASLDAADMVSPPQKMLQSASAATIK